MTTMMMLFISSDINKVSGVKAKQDQSHQAKTKAKASSATKGWRKTKWQNAEHVDELQSPPTH